MDKVDHPKPLRAIFSYQNSQGPDDELQHRMILYSEVEDKLTWGRKGGRQFTLKKAKKYLIEYQQDATTPEWSKLWSTRQWPKIKLFIYLVMQKNIPTWEKL